MNNTVLKILMMLFLLQKNLAASKGFRQIGCMVIAGFFSREILKICVQNQ